MSTFADKVIQFNHQLHYRGKLPKNIRIMNPFRENPEVIPIMETFYRKFYNDQRKRKFIIGINPGRLGAGVTGIPFTDTKRLIEVCHIPIQSANTYEPSSVFVYDVIKQYGGVKKFYGDYYINSICPLGFIEKNNRGHWVNRNYYDYPELFEAVKDFMLRQLKKQIALGIDTETCYVWGRKNVTYLRQIIAAEKLFSRIVVFDHPRYIEQYKAKNRTEYLEDYLKKLRLDK